MSERHCCHIPCDKPAEFVILSNDQPGPETIDACAEHVGALLEDGVSTVWPIAAEATA